MAHRQGEGIGAYHYRQARGTGLMSGGGTGIEPACGLELITWRGKWHREQRPAEVRRK
jgi:hypothetical protein